MKLLRWLWELFFVKLTRRSYKFRRVKKQRKIKGKSAYDYALGEIGVSEFPGRASNERIELYHSYTNSGKDSEEIPWCSSFVCYCVEMAGFKSTRSKTARSWMKWGERVSKPEEGDIAVFLRGKKKGWQGHVAFYVKTEGEYIVILGGNQANAVSLTRKHKKYLLGFRRAK